MRIEVSQTKPTTHDEDVVAWLTPVTWNDWFKYSTMYFVRIIEGTNPSQEIGHVKIGRVDAPTDMSHTLPTGTYDSLPVNHFSIGQDADYYEELSALPTGLRTEYLEQMCDFVHDNSLYEMYRGEQVVYDSLLRYVSWASAKGEFRRALTGAARLTPYNLIFRSEEIELALAVDPQAVPRNNVHAIIGTNGVGKTRLLQRLAGALLHDTEELVARDEDGFEEGGVFSGVVYVSFSALDPYAPPPSWHANPELHFQYVGLKKRQEDESYLPITYEDLDSDFIGSVVAVKKHGKATRWLDALSSLESDPVFNTYDLEMLALDGNEGELRMTFKGMSDGHKSVMLTVTKLIEHIEERTLIVLDEPEAHLHPPLLSALTNAIADIARHRNAVVIMATHSPVILQELPRSCAHILRRDASQSETRVSEPSIETYGESVATLTHEVFGLEVMKTGYYHALAVLAETHGSYEEALEGLGDQLGTEGRSLLRALFLHKT